jgi:hypothetical protein
MGGETHPGSKKSEGEDYCRFDPDAEHDRRLEYGAAPALRTPLAGLSEFAISFC